MSGLNYTPDQYLKKELDAARDILIKNGLSDLDAIIAILKVEVDVIFEIFEFGGFEDDCRGN